MRAYLFSVLPVAPLALSTSGCSLVLPPRATPEAKAAVLRVTNDYLTAIMLGKVDAAQGLIVWSDYSKAKKLTRESFREQVAVLKTLYTPVNHPLTGLVPVEISGRGDSAEIRLRKHGEPNAPEIKVSYLWGDGWLVVDDNLFGEDGMITKLVVAQNPS